VDVVNKSFSFVGYFCFIYSLTFIYTMVSYLLLDGFKTFAHK